jgi:hypothetical protein
MRPEQRPAPLLSLSRARYKYLTGPLEALPSTEELCQRGRSQSVGRDRGEQNEYRLALSAWNWKGGAWRSFGMFRLGARVAGRIPEMEG